MPSQRMTWESLLCQERLYPKPLSDTQDRSCFEVDYDRLIFSKAFRRLARKTQVHPLALNDHTHNRLTHSLEVASVGRSLGKSAYFIVQNMETSPVSATANEFAELVQAACLAHDIGNTPFGHAGERAIRHWMNNHMQLLSAMPEAEQKDLTLYEGNAQAFRIATRSVSEFEPGCTNRQGGIGLTAATLATMMKYPWYSDHAFAQAAGKYSVFQNDVPAFEWVATSTGLLHQENAYCRHPLAFLVEAADDICNAIIDIEDAIDLSILSREQVESALMQLSGLPEDSSIAQMRAKAIGSLIQQCLQVFEASYNSIMMGQHQVPLIELIDKEMLTAFNHLNKIARTEVYPFQQDDGLAQSCNLTLARILDATILTGQPIRFAQPDAITEPLKEFTEKMSAEMVPDYHRYMMVMDFVAGMTDNYAINLADRLEIAAR